jgi:hypothetical protein
MDMPESVRITMAPLTKMVIPLAVGTMIAFLAITAIGTILALTVWPAMRVVYDNANRALGAAGYFVNLITVVLACLFISWLAMVGARNDSQHGLSPVLRQSTHYLLLAKVVTVVALFETTFAFIRQEASNFVVVQIGNATQLDFLSITWAVALGFVLPVALLVLLLLFIAKRAKRQALAPGN